ncbi:hypothetical protein KEM55_006271 [Ascosphaera atra]|nr:hypothetical protein KEM55_006271 [Ascosphaera atra]
MSTETTSAPPSEMSDQSNPALAFDESKLPVTAAEGETLKLPFRCPAPDAEIATPPALTEEQETKYQQVHDAVSKWTELPVSSAKNAEKKAMTDDERMFCTRDCMLRYLRATKWHVEQAIERLERTLVWRREYGVEEHTADYISIELETGKMVVQGYDNNGRPCLYLNPSKQNTERTPRQVQALVFMLERMIDLMMPNQESMALIVDFKSAKASQNASIGQGRETLNILQNHYPERLGRAMVTNIPFAINGFFKLITPFIDPVTRQKLKFNEDLRSHVPPSQLLASHGGDAEFEYDHSVYWPALIGMAEKRREEYKQRWIKAGKKIGERESYLRGAEE